MKLVRQKHEDGCAVAVFAMLTGRTYAAAVKRLGFVAGDGGLRHGALKRELEREGRFCRTVDDRRWTLGEWPPRPFAPQHFAVVHQNDTGNAHVVAMDNCGVLFDPLGAQRPARLDAYQVVQEVVGVL